MSELELKIVESHGDTDDLKPGEAIIYARQDKTHGLILACPQCGFVSSGNHKYNEETKTLSPSVICNKCGWHGMVENGKIRTV